MTQATKSLLARPGTGSLNPRLNTISTNFVRDEPSGLAFIVDDEIIEAALRILAKRVASGPVIGSMTAARDYLALRFADLEHEVFSVMYLTKRHRLIACEELFRGTIDGASVHPRIVVKEALRHNAAACLISHNHPSGQASPSSADEAITQRIRDALNLVDVRLLDHIIAAGGSTFSFAENGLL